MAYDNPFTLGLLRRFEGYTPKPKWDEKQYSVGYSTRWTPGTPIGTREDHERELAREAGVVDAYITNNVKAPLSPQQRAALTSFGFNLGPGAIGRLAPDLNAGNYDRVAQRMLTFARVGNNPNALNDRRRQEAELFLGKSVPQTEGPASAGAPMAAPIGGAPVAGGPVPLEIAPQGNKRFSKLADMLLAQAAGAKPRGWGELLNSAGDLALGYTMANKADTQDQAHQSSLAKALMGSGGDIGKTADVLIQSGDPDMMKTGISAKIAAAKKEEPLRGKNRFITMSDGRIFDTQLQQPVAGIGPKEDKAPAGYRPTDDGNLAFIPGGPADPNVKPKGRDKYTEVQTKAANFGNMMTKAEEEFTKKAQSQGIKPDEMQNPKNTLGAIRDAVVPFEGLRNVMTPEDTQAYNQMASQWIRAKLRKESGAAIGADEMAQEFKTYFPQYGDSPKVIQQKAAARAEATKGMIAESNGAYGAMFGPNAVPADAAAPIPAPAAPATPNSGGAPAQPKTQQEYMALPPGTPYVAPDGSLRTKQ